MLAPTTTEGGTRGPFGKNDDDEDSHMSSRARLFSSKEGPVSDPRRPPSSYRLHQPALVKGLLGEEDHMHAGTPHGPTHSGERRRRGSGLLLGALGLAMLLPATARAAQICPAPTP